MFCGDGINDLAALSAADVGMAIGATDAVIAAELSTSHGSIADEQGTGLHCFALHCVWYISSHCIHPNACNKLIVLTRNLTLL